MSLMPDPMIVLDSMQEALDKGMSIKSNELDADYEMFYDEPFIDGKRYTFAKIINQKVQVISIFGLEDPIEDVICYNVGYAVKKDYQGRGLAVESVNKGIEKLKHEFGLNRVTKFYVEAVIDIQNTYSINVAKKLFCCNGIAMIDRDTGTPALHFKRLIVI